MSEGTCFLSIFFTHRTVKPLALCPAGCTHCSGLSSSAGSTLLYSEGWWASGVGSIWTNQSCFARKDVVFMATLAGRACARSAGERKTSEKSKNRFKKTGHLLRGLSVSLCLLFCRLLVLLACSCLSVRPSVHSSDNDCDSCTVFSLAGCRERKRKLMQADIRRPNHSQPSHRSTSLRKEKQRKSPAKSTQSQSFLLLPQKHHQKKVHTIAHTYMLFWI